MKLPDYLGLNPDLIRDGTPVFERYIDNDHKSENEYNSGQILNQDSLQRYLDALDTNSNSICLRKLLEEQSKYFPKPFKFLEIGCGYGVFSAILSKRTKKGVAIDINYDFLHIAKQYAKQKGVSFRTCLIPSQGMGYAFKHDYFDFVFANAVVHHIKDLDDFFCSVSAVLKDGGMFSITGEPMVGKLRKNKELEHTATKGLQDVPYSIRDYVKSAKKYFKVTPRISKSLLYYPNDVKRIRNSKLRAIFFGVLAKVFKYDRIRTCDLVENIYFLVTYLFGGLPVDFFCRRK